MTAHASIAPNSEESAAASSNMLLAVKLAILSEVMLFGALFAAYFVIRGERAVANPWRAHTLEWQVSSPPPIQNFDQIPTVSAGPYEFGGSAGAPAEGRAAP